MAERTEPGGKGGWYHGWTIVAVLMLSQVAGNALTYNTFSLFLPGWSSALHAPVSKLLLAIVALVLVASPISPVVGAWADRAPARRLFAIGLVGMALFHIAMSFVARPWQIVALYGLLAAPALTLCTSVPANALISRWFVRRIGLALGLSTFGIGLGGVVAPSLVAWLLPKLGWRLIWRGAGVLLVGVVLPLVAGTLRDRPDPARDGLHYLTADSSDTGIRSHGHGHGGASGSAIGWCDVFSRRNFWLLVASYLLIMGPGAAFVQNIAPLAASRGFGASASGLLLSTVGASHIVATLLLGLAADRFGAKLPMMAMALTVAAGLLTLAIAHSLPLLVLGAALIGINAGVFTPLAVGIAREFGAEGFGRAFGATMLFLPLSTPLAFLAAKSQEQLGSYLPAAAGGAVLLMLGALLSLGIDAGEKPRLAPI